MAITFEIEPIPNGSYLLRGYTELGRPDYSGECIVSERAPGEREIYAWMVKPELRGYMRPSIELVKNEIGAETITGSFDVNRMRVYTRLLRMQGIAISPIRKFIKRYNGVDIEFQYFEVCLDG